MKPFFNYFGGKWRSSVYYPSPQFDTVIEPFCGGGGYSVRRSNGRKVLLYDLDETIIGIWDYLIHAKENRVLSLPDIEFGTLVSDEKYKLCQEEKDLIGFWMNTGCVSPRKQPSAYYDPAKDPTLSKYLWGARLRLRLAHQLKKIRHWKAIQCSYLDVPNIEGCWFVDPPYVKHGNLYKHGSDGIDYNHLASWCESRKGQFIVCEGAGADWLEFQEFKRIQAKYDPKKHRELIEKGSSNIAFEVIYTNTPNPEQLALF